MILYPWRHHRNIGGRDVIPIRKLTHALDGNRWTTLPRKDMTSALEIGAFQNTLTSACPGLICTSLKLFHLSACSFIGELLILCASPPPRILSVARALETWLLLMKTHLGSVKAGAEQYLCTFPLITEDCSGNRWATQVMSVLYCTVLSICEYWTGC